MGDHGLNSQLSSRAFWKDTHGTCEDRACDGGAGPELVITPLTQPFTQGYPGRYALLPADCGYSSGDMVYAIAGAIAREKSAATASLTTTTSLPAVPISSRGSTYYCTP